MGSRSRPFLLAGGLLPFVAFVLDQHLDDTMAFLATVVTMVSIFSLGEIESEATLVSNVAASLDGVAGPTAEVSLFSSMLLASCGDCNAVVVTADGDGEVGGIKVETADGGVGIISLGTSVPLGTPRVVGGNGGGSR